MSQTPIRQTDRKGLVYFHHSQWDATGLVVHGFLTRRGGTSPAPSATLNDGPLSGDGPENVRENLGRIASALDISPEGICCARQVHGASVLEVHSDPIPLSVFSSPAPLQCDGLTTDRPGTLIGVLTADCVPLLLFDPGPPAVAAIHAGWRGARSKIPVQALQRLRALYGSQAQEVQAVIGPAIGPCCYRVGNDVASALHQEDPEYTSFLRGDGPNRWQMDLPGLVRHQLLRNGMRSDRLWLTDQCTSCTPGLFFSARADGEPTGRQLSLIGLRPAERG